MKITDLISRYPILAPCADSIEKAAELLYTLVLAEKSKKALLPIPSFSEYEQALKTVGCEIKYYLM